MVVHVAPRGSDMPGLMRYLYGPGKADEHRDQRMVAGSAMLPDAYVGSLGTGEATQLGNLLERAWHLQAAEQLAIAGGGHGGVTYARRGRVGPAGEGGGDVLDVDVDAQESPRRPHTYHLIASLPPGAEWTDEQWATVAGDLVEGMGLATGPGDENGSRWVAMRHGPSSNGNDHLHIAVSLVRQDGRWARLPANDYALANRARQAIEDRYDFVLPLHDKTQPRTSTLPAYSMSEHQVAKDRGRDKQVPDRVLLRQVVRSAALTAATEAEFIDAVTDVAGVEVTAARWDLDERGRVTGYQVRQGEDGLWFSASSLAPDLTLGRLRPGWEPNETAQSQARAAALWTGQGELAPAPQAEAPGPHLQAAEAHLRAWNDQLEQLDPGERDGWKVAAGHAAGAVGTLSRSPGWQGGRFAIAGETLARHALPEHGTHPPVSTPRGTPAGPSGPGPAELAARHLAVALRASSPDRNRGWQAVVSQLGRTAQAVHAAQQARGELAAARATNTGAVAVIETAWRSLAPDSGPVLEAGKTGAEYVRQLRAAGLPNRGVPNVTTGQQAAPGREADPHTVNGPDRSRDRRLGR